MVGGYHFGWSMPSLCRGCYGCLKRRPMPLQFLEHIPMLSCSCSCWTLLPFAEVVLLLLHIRSLGESADFWRFGHTSYTCRVLIVIFRWPKNPRPTSLKSFRMGIRHASVSERVEGVERDSFCCKILKRCDTLICWSCPKRWVLLRVRVRTWLHAHNSPRSACNRSYQRWFQVQFCANFGWPQILHGPSGRFLSDITTWFLICNAFVVFEGYQIHAPVKLCN